MTIKTVWIFAAVAATLNAGLSTISLSSSSNPSTAGAAVTLTATVTPSSATGTVTFLDGPTTIGAGTLSSGSATLTTAVFTAGTHNLTASYGGDSSNSGSASSVDPQIVNASTGTLSGVIPISSQQGATSLSMTIIGNATHFSTLSVVTFSGTGITAGAPTAATATSLTVPVTVAANAPLGAQGIQVVSGGETVSLPNVFTVTGINSSITFTYDSQGRLSTAIYAPTMGSPSVTVTYSYDAAGNRTSVVTQ